MEKFRDLRADEIECRIAMVKEDAGSRPGGISLLLYKDARVDQNILDESVGSMNWKREHQAIDGKMFCAVSIWDEGKRQWVSKQDVGVESNTEATKGEASDSFKRACFNWGIGRELYTAPFIWVTNGKGCEVKQKKCYDRFSVKSIAITDKRITALEIINSSTGQVVFRMGTAPPNPANGTRNNGARGNVRAGQEKGQEEPRRPSRAEEEQKNREMMERAGAELIDATKIRVIKDVIAQKGLSPQSILEHYKLESFEEMTMSAWTDAMAILERYRDRGAD